MTTAPAPVAETAPAAVPAPATETTAETGYVEAELTYTIRTDERPVRYKYDVDDEKRTKTETTEAKTMRIHDGRAVARDLSLDDQGFVLTRHDSAVADFYDDAEVRSVYYPEIERLVKDATGASKVIIFDHTTRIDGPTNAGGEIGRTGVRQVHNDYTVKSGPQRVRDLLDADEAEQRLRGRFAQINVWRPITGPVERTPLALIDAQSIAEADLVPVDLVYEDRVGEIYHGAYNPDHRWYYFPEMRADEAILIKGYDSAEDGRARFTPHTAFDDPTTAADAAPRESIEVRVLAFFD
jgi:hypothetical protein